MAKSNKPRTQKPKSAGKSKQKKGITQIPMTITSRMLKKEGMRAKPDAKLNFNRNVENVAACMASHVASFAKVTKHKKTVFKDDVTAAFKSDSVKDCFSNKWILS